MKRIDLAPMVIDMGACGLTGYYFGWAASICMALYGLWNYREGWVRGYLRGAAK